MKTSENVVKILSKAKNLVSKAEFKLKKHSPEILLAGGIITSIIGVVAACKATTKVSEIVEKTENDIKLIHESAENGCITTENGEEKYTEDDKNRDLTIVYIQTGIRFIKLYAPAALFGILSLTSILASHNILRKRNVSLAVAYGAVDKAFKEYKKRVAEHFGEEAEKDIRYNIKAKTVTDTLFDPETGEEKQVEKTIKVIDPDIAQHSPYSKFFDESSLMWEKNAEANRFFLTCVQNWANDKLRAEGHLFLNDVYEELGLEPTIAGQTVGWIYDPDDDNRDSYVDFGIYDPDDISKQEFVNGHNRSILLDFNCDGDILHDKKFMRKYRAI